MEQPKRKEKSIAKESTICLICRIINVLLTLISSIYIARVISPSDLGMVRAAQNLTQYFVIIAHLGIPAYGMREIARHKKNRNELNNIYSELMIINTIFTTISLFLYAGIVFSVPDYRSCYPVYLIVGLLIFLNYFNNTWMFEGVEEISKLSIRMAVSKAIYIVLMVLLVKNTDNYLIYASLIVVCMAINFFLNMISTHKFVTFSTNDLNFKRHMKPILVLVCVTVANLIHGLTDITMINLMCGDDKKHVAYYSYANSTKTILITLISSISYTVIPRLNYYYKKKEVDKCNKLISKSFIVILILAVPSIIGIWFTADCLFVEIYGAAYSPAANILKMLSFLILISPICDLIGSPILLATGNENKILFPVITGAIINVVLNSFMIILWHEMGAAIASVISRSVVLFIYVIINKNRFKLINIRESILKILIASAITVGYLYGARFIPLDNLYITLIQISGAIVIYFSMLLVQKESVTNLYYKKVIKKFCKRKNS